MNTSRHKQQLIWLKDYFLLSKPSRLPTTSDARRRTSTGEYAIVINTHCRDRAVVSEIHASSHTRETLLAVSREERSG